VIPRRCSPRELCAWFEDTYDFHMLDEDCQGELVASFMAAIEEECGSAGKVEYNDLLYLITATRDLPSIFGDKRGLHRR
jgi:hypothetical protein